MIISIITLVGNSIDMLHPKRACNCLSKIKYKVFGPIRVTVLSHFFYNVPGVIHVRSLHGTYEHGHISFFIRRNPENHLV